MQRKVGVWREDERGASQRKRERGRKKREKEQTRKIHKDRGVEKVREKGKRLISKVKARIFYGISFYL